MDQLAGYIATGIISLVVGLLLQKMANKPKLRHFLPGSFIFEVSEPKVTVRTDSITLQNFGSAPATNVEVIYKERPDHFQFSQSVSYTEAQNPNGEFLIKIASLGPKEFVNIQVLSHIKPPVLLSVRSDSGVSRLMQVRFQPIMPSWFNVAAITCFVSGFGFLLYWLVKFVWYLVQSFIGGGNP